MSGWLVLKTAAVAYERGTPYLAISNLLRSWFGIPEQALPAEAKRRLHEALAALPAGSSIYVPALQWLLDLPVEDADWPALDAAERRQRMRSTLKDLCLRCAENQPLLLWFEDIQWTDVETQGVIHGSIELFETARMFVFVTCRPEYEHKWDGKPFLTAINLDPLEAQAADDWCSASSAVTTPSCELSLSSAPKERRCSSRRPSEPWWKTGPCGCVPAAMS